MNKCEVCGNEFEGRSDAKYCSAVCRKQASRTIGVTSEQIIVEEPVETLIDDFEFKTKNSRTDSGFYENEDGTINVRKRKYWYDVPFGAIPIIKNGSPKMPDFMNGREYFLWRANDFKTIDGIPVIKNPVPKFGKIEFVKGGAQSRMWGA